MDGKITSVDKAVSERMKQFMAHYGYTQVAIAEACNVDVSTLSRYMNNKKPWSSKMLQKIGSVFNVAFLWLRDGIGEMFAEEKAIGKAQFAAFSQMLNANASPVSQNVISGDKLQGTQTINATEGKISALEQKIEALAQLLAEKDKLIASQQAWLADKDKLITRQEAEIAELRERLKKN
jgi:transcriptional regulator with XRE-family HTH domain